MDNWFFIYLPVEISFHTFQFFRSMQTTTITIYKLKPQLSRASSLPCLGRHPWPARAAAP